MPEHRLRQELSDRRYYYDGGNPPNDRGLLSRSANVEERDCRSGESRTRAAQMFALSPCKRAISDRHM